jgi:hypothetical protein
LKQSPQKQRHETKKNKQSNTNKSIRLMIVDGLPKTKNKKVIDPIDFVLKCIERGRKKEKNRSKQVLDHNCSLFPPNTTKSPLCHAFCLLMSFPLFSLPSDCLFCVGEFLCAQDLVCFGRVSKLLHQTTQRPSLKYHNTTQNSLFLSLYFSQPFFFTFLCPSFFVLVVFLFCLQSFVGTSKTCQTTKHPRLWL